MRPCRFRDIVYTTSCHRAEEKKHAGARFSKKRKQAPAVFQVSRRAGLVGLVEDNSRRQPLDVNRVAAQKGFADRVLPRPARADQHRFVVDPGEHSRQCRLHVAFDAQIAEGAEGKRRDSAAVDLQLIRPSDDLACREGRNQGGVNGVPFAANERSGVLALRVHWVFHSSCCIRFEAPDLVLRYRRQVDMVSDDRVAKGKGTQ